ncbi:MAG: sugar ABC transporter substrate-binding protein [Nakamurella sp.]
MKITSGRRVAVIAASLALLAAGCSKQSDTSATPAATPASAAPMTSAGMTSADTSGGMTSADTSASSDSMTSSPGSTSSAGPASSQQEVSAGGAGDFKIAFLMPDQASTRYEQHDRPGFEAELKRICPGCTTLYNNANASAATQQQQFNAAISQGATVIVLDPVDSTAAAGLVQTAQSQNVKVIAYDRPVPEAKADYYVSFDNEKIGTLIAQSLVEKLKSGTIPDGGGILEVNGSPTDAAAGLIKKGIHAGLEGSGLTMLAEYDTPEWDPAKAQTWVSGQISRFPDKIVGVVAANDGTGGGAIAAFKAAGVNPVPSITGNDATIAGLQLIISGDQYNTISKPSEIVAAAAADVAYGLAQGTAPQSDTVVFNTPSKLFTPVVITQQNLKAEIIDKKIQTAAELCTADYATACQKLGIS